MRIELLGLELERAVALLSAQGVTPRVRVTRAPKDAREGGALRVVYASDDGRELVAAAFHEPLRA